MEYFANLEPDDIVPELQSRFRSYVEWTERSGYRARIMESYSQYYGFSKEGTLRIQKSEDNAITKINVNHFRNIIKNLVQLICQSKIDYFMTPRPGDADATATAYLGRGVIDYYKEEFKLSLQFRKLVEMALVCQEGFAYVPYEFERGREVRPDGEEIIKGGDNALYLLTPLHVARPVRSKKQYWKILELKENKYDLAAQYPQLADVILKCEDEDDIFGFRWAMNVDGKTDSFESDEVKVYHFLHEATDACPQGRFIKYVGGQWLEDDRDLKRRYDRVPVYRLAPGDIMESIAAHSPGIDILPIQQVVSALFSALVTNAINLSIMDVYAPDPNTKFDKVGGAMRLWKGAQPPQGLALLNSSPETYQLLNLLLAQETQLSGLNDVVRGSVQNAPQLKSGTALALVLTQAIQYVSEIQESLTDVATDVADQLIKNIQRNATTEHVARLGGPGAQTYTREFQKEDIMGIERVRAELQNPLMSTQAGRTQVGENLLDKQMIPPEEYLNLIVTGQMPESLDKVAKIKQSIQSENQALRAGENVPVLFSDRHEWHVPEHIALLSEPETRRNPALVERVRAHVQAHLDEWRSMDPALSQLLGHMPPPGMSPEGMAQGGGGAEAPNIQDMPQADMQEPMTPPELPRIPGVPAEAPEALRESIDQFRANVTDQMPIQ
jgi:hypothetical protein